LNILVVNWMDIKNPAAGGAELYSWEICKRFIEEGNTVEFITSKGGSLIDNEKVDNIDIVRIGNIFTMYSKAFFFVSENLKKYDLVIEIVNGPPFLLPIKVPSSKHIVIIFHLPTFIAVSKKLLLLGPLEFILSRLLLRVFYSHRKVITDGDNTKEELKKLGLNEVYVAEDGLNGYDNLDDESNNKDKIAVILGPLKPWKRIDHGIMAFSVLPSPWKLLILGRGDKRYIKRLQNMVRDMRLEGRVKFKGYVDEKAKAYVISKSMLAIITSEKEGFSLTALECQRYGCVPVMYKFPGMENSVIPGITSLVLLDGDIKGIQETLLRLSSDEETLNRLSQQGREFSMRFTWDKTYQKIKNVINQKL
jgi:glycosyltransferase involved in cell wall biosynthesis